VEIAPLHSWDLPLTEAAALQKELAQQLDVTRALKKCKLIAGADCSYNKYSPTMYADYRFATVNGKAVKDLINDPVWNAEVFLPTVGKRGAAIIEARGLSSAASAANAAIDHMRDWALSTNGKWVTMGVPSNGDYGIPKDVMFGFPVTTKDGKYEIVKGLPSTNSARNASTRRSRS
jgi:malate/lactate dehydrogenase